MRALPARTTLRLRATLRDSAHHVKFRAMIDDLQFLIGRPEEAAFIADLERAVHHRRLWVQEREAATQARGRTRGAR